MVWRDLNENGLTDICHTPMSSSKNLRKLAEKMEWVSYAYYDQSVPIMYMLRERNARVNYGNPNNRMGFVSKYGFSNKAFQRYYTELFDHTMLFKNTHGKVYMCINPYEFAGSMLADKVNLLNNLKRGEVDKDEFGDWSDLQVEVIPKEKGYYFPGTSCCILLSV